jgi:hypothetical protein
MSAAIKPAPGDPAAIEGAQPRTRYFELIRGDSIAPEPVSWLWNGYLLGGKLNILAGAPGTGKTTVALEMAAAVSTGGNWPDGSAAPCGDVLIWSGEDTWQDVLVPRLRACGADTRRIHFVRGIRSGGQLRGFNPARDIPDLRGAMLGQGVWKLMIIDSIVSAVSGGGHNNGAVRKSLEPLGALADATGCAILGIAHFTKGTAGRDPLERVAGSLAFGAYARLVLGVARRKAQNGGKCILTRAKSNLGLDGGGFVYDIEQIETPGCAEGVAARVVWGEALKGSAQKILAEAEEEDATYGGVREVETWLARLIAEEGGTVDRADVMKAAAALGYKDRRSVWSTGKTP